MSTHDDAAVYAAGLLDEQEARSFEEHAAGCDACRRDVEELTPVAALLALAPAETPEPPPGLAARTLLAVDRAARDQARAEHAAPPRRWWRPVLVPALAAACVLAGLLAGGLLRSGGGDRPGQRLEAVAALEGARGQVASVELVKTGIGRVVSIDTVDLPILPTGEYYELWFVGPGDRRNRPDRISAGTFHPDVQGRSRVTFAAAVDPAEYRRVAVTAEPGDGNPAPHGPDVMSGPVQLRTAP